jgi:hypothetical protein
MADTPAFFVPFATPEDQEEVYAGLAEWAHKNYAPVMRWKRDLLPPREQRIYSITFSRDDERWTATVGEKLRGERSRKPRRRGAFQRVETLSDRATVLAIFPGDPCIIRRKPMTESDPKCARNPIESARRIRSKPMMDSDPIRSLRR